MPNINSTVSPATEEILQGAGPITLDGVKLGSFRDGVTITFNANYNWTRSDYAVGEIDGEMMTAEMSVNTTLEQATARNMCIALGGNTSSSSSSSSSVRWDFGPEMSLTASELVLAGMSPMATDGGLAKQTGRKYTFFRALRMGSTAQTLKRGTEQLLPVTFKCLMNTSDKYFRLEEPFDLSTF